MSDIQNVQVQAEGKEAIIPKARREPVNYLYSKLNWGFIKLLAQIAHYAEGKYGAAEQYTESELQGDRAPINHIAEHLRQYLEGELHDHFGTRQHHLAAIAYNAMMEFFYLNLRGPAEPLYSDWATKPFPKVREDSHKAQILAPYVPGGVAKAADILQESIDSIRPELARASSFKRV